MYAGTWPARPRSHPKPISVADAAQMPMGGTIYPLLPVYIGEREMDSASWSYYVPLSVRRCVGETMMFFRYAYVHARMPEHHVQKNL